MRVAYLGPFANHYLTEVFPDFTPADVSASPGMGGFGLVETVLERMRSGKPTVLVTLDDHLKGRCIKRTNGPISFYSYPRRPRGAARDLYKTERGFIGAAIADSKPDILHVHWTSEYAVAALTSSGAGVPVLLTVRDHALDVVTYLGLRQLPRFLLALWTIRKASNVTTVSPHVYQFLARLGKNRLWLVENPVSERVLDGGRNAASFGQDPPLIVSTTIWSRLKNPKAALRAFGLLRRDGLSAVLHLCGSGMDADGPGARWARSHGLDAGVMFRGNLAHEDLIGLLQKASVYLHTARTEAFNTAISEAMALGVPVIGGARSGGVPYHLDYGRAGLLVNVDNPRAIAGALRELITNETARQGIRRAAWARVDALCRPSVVLDAYEGIYNTVLAEATEQRRRLENTKDGNDAANF